MPQGEERTYRGLIGTQGLVTFRVSVKETDLLISARADLSLAARDEVLNRRRSLEEYITANPAFLTALEPLADDPLAPALVRRMLAAGQAAGTGPMAAVAGAVAEAVGRALKPAGGEVIVENGGDLYLDTDRELSVAIHAGKSPLSARLALKIAAHDQPLGLATSSATVGHSLSFGRADAAVVAAASPAVADAAATALGNRVIDARDIGPALEALARVEGVSGGVVIVGRSMGAWGGLELVRL